MEIDLASWRVMLWCLIDSLLVLTGLAIVYLAWRRLLPAVEAIAEWCRADMCDCDESPNDPTTRPCHVTINGRLGSFYSPMSYGEVLRALGYQDDAIVSMTWKSGDGKMGGILLPGDSINIAEGTSITAMQTGNG